MSDASELNPLTDAELSAQSGTALPDKEVVSILDLNADLDLALDVAAPIDLAVAANANVAAPIDAAVGANILSVGSTSTSLADQGVIIDQGITGDVSPRGMFVRSTRIPGTGPMLRLRVNLPEGRTLVLTGKVVRGSTSISSAVRSRTCWSA